MKLRNLLVLALASLVGACSGGSYDGDDGDGPTHDAGATDASIRADVSVRFDGGASMDTSNADGFASFPDSGGFTPDAARRECEVEVHPMTVPSLDQVTGGPGAFVGIRGQIEGEPRPASPQWEWTVTRNGAPAAFDKTDNPAVIYVPLVVLGEYDVSVRVSPTCKNKAPVKVQAVARQNRSQHFLLRVVPPPESGLPPQDLLEEVIAGASEQADLRLAPGQDVAIVPRTPSLLPPWLLVPSFIRVSSKSSSFEREGSAVSAAGFVTKLSPLGILRAGAPHDGYDVLVVPQDSGLPPLLLTGQSASALRQLYVDITPGVAVRGVVTMAGQPLQGARLMLRKTGGDDDGRSTQPSTVGTTAGDGAFTLRARPGQHTLRVVPPVDSVLPTLHLPASQPVTISETATTAGLSVDYAAAATATLTLTVRQPDGVTAATNTVVEVRSRESLLNVATLLQPGQEPQTLSGSLAITRATNNDGRVTVAGLPRGDYDVVLRPPASRAWAAAFQTPMTIDLRGGDVTRTVALAAAVKVTGKLSVPRDNPAGLRVVARVATKAGEATAADVEDVYAPLAADGTFTWMLSPNTAYDMRIDAPLGRLVPRIFLGSIFVGSSDDTIPALAPVPASLRFSGRVLTNDGKTLPGTVLQAFCLDRRSGCIDYSDRNVGTAVPISDAVAGPDGSFVLVLPDPGT